MGKNIYALYRGDTFLNLGTLEELGKEFNVKPTTIYFYTTPAHKRRMEKRKSNYNNNLIAIKIEEGEG